MGYVIFWPLVAWALFSKRPVAIYLFFGTMCFGAFSAIPPGVTGGITVLPKMVCGPLLVLRMMARPGGLPNAWAAITHYRKLGFLTLFMAVAILVTLFAPRLFVGAVDVIGLNTADVRLLTPSGTNFSQLVYLFFSYVIVVALFLATQTADDRETVIKALVLGATIAVATGVLDLATHGTGFLTPFRTASYVMMADQEIAGSQRIVGLMSEASAYGGLCLFFGSALYFLRPGLRLEGRFALFYWGAMAAVLLMAALSTASSAYLGLGAFGALLFADWLYRTVTTRETAERIRVFREFAVAGIVAIGLLMLFLLRPSLFQPVINMIDTLIFKKAESASYAERSMWNRVSFEALFSTYGLGVGVGSTRASSWPIAVAASTGLAGIAAMGGFLLQTFLRGGKDLGARDAKMLSGAKQALLVSLVPGAAAGTLVDFGALNAVLFAITAALGAQAQQYVPPRWKRAPLRHQRRRPLSKRPRLAARIR